MKKKGMETPEIIPITIKDFPKGLHTELKVLSAQRRITLKALIVEILEKEIKRIKG